MKYPNLEEKIIKPDQMLFRFDCGDLWKRQNVDKLDDIDECLKTIELALKKNKTKFKKFEWVMNYSVPYVWQAESLNKNKIKSFSVDEDNLHMVEPLRFLQSEQTLFVSEDLLIKDGTLVSNLANKLNGLKKLYFWMTPLFGGFLEDHLKDHDVRIKYIQKDLKNENWHDNFFQIKEAYQPEFMDKKDIDGKYGNDLDSLIYLRGSIDPKVKFEFSFMDKEEEKILRENSII